MHRCLALTKSLDKCELKQNRHQEPDGFWWSQFQLVEHMYSGWLELYLVLKDHKILPILSPVSALDPYSSHRPPSLVSMTRNNSNQSLQKKKMPVAKSSSLTLPSKSIIFGITENSLIHLMVLSLHRTNLQFIPCRIWSTSWLIHQFPSENCWVLLVSDICECIDSIENRLCRQNTEENYKSDFKLRKRAHEFLKQKMAKRLWRTCLNIGFVVASESRMREEVIIRG